ncbi:MAG: aromatic ring-hydroxylating dioxygenase subunit alpha [Rhodospirillales bacterium]|nr:aromatic ring-hydroxylating dioxygenase subunit alpha [Rhodospirillales bacterium]
MQALKNQWYCAAFGHELQHEPLGRIFLNEAVVMYRKADGTPVAFEDRCCHRRAPLSKGTVEGDNLRCGYHGFLYDTTGAVVSVPGQDVAPPDARVRSFPVTEKHGWIWVWMGDPALADPETAPAYDKYDHANWASYGSLIPVQANYFLMVDNLLDLSHLPYLHANTIGSPEDTNPNLSWDRGTNAVKGVRVARGLSPSPSNISQGLDFPFDRTQIMHFEPPSQVTIDIVMNEFGKEYGAPDDRMNRRIIIYDSITPETDTSCHYFWAIARDFGIDDPEVTETGLRATSAAFHEDKVMLEAEQKIIDMDPSAPQVDVIGDTGSLQARRILEGMLAEESGLAPRATAAE